MKEQIVGVDFFYKLVATKVFERAQRTARCNAPGSEESI